MILRIPCPTCGVPQENTGCDGCGADITKVDEALVLAVGLTSRAAPQYVKVYCPSCAPKYLPPEALGVGPGSDLPASVDDPSGTAPSAPTAPVE
jgi:hypothetical protein